MNYDLTPQITDRLKTHYHFKPRGEHLREGVCPECEKKSLWTWKATPGMVQCNRVSKCGYTETTKNLFPDLYQELDKKYPATQENPNATADSYLALVRGFPLDNLRGAYTQHSYWHPKGDRGSTSIRFYLDMANGVYWERLIDDVTLTLDDGCTEIRNKSFKGSFRGLWWMPPGQKIEARDQVYLTEGVFDAIALWLSGKKACAIMSAGSLPKATLEKHFHLNIVWVLALDNDKAGRSYTRKHVKWLKEHNQKTSALFSSDGESKHDWNDLYQENKLTQEDLRDYRYFGRLELVNSAQDKAQLIYDHHQGKKRFFVFNHFNCMYRCTVNKEKYDDASKDLSDTENSKEAPKSSTEVLNGSFSMSAEVMKESNCITSLLYVLESNIGEDPVYCIRVDFENSTPTTLIYFSGAALSSPTEFKKALFVKAPGARIKKSAASHEMMIEEWYKEKLMNVITLEYAGYNKSNQAYIFNDYAVQNGKVIKVNQDDYFELKAGGMKTAIPLKQKLTQTPSVNWYQDFKAAYGMGGLVSLSWWVGSLFAEQIRQEYRSFPFLEIIGEAGSGKTDLETFLWKITGREGDNFNPNSSSFVGVTRKLSQLSNMPIVFNETDNETAAKSNHLKKFNWDEWKGLYNGEIDRHTGVKTQDNKTRSSPFRAALCAIQNIPVVASEAILSRFLHVQIDRAHHTPEGKKASDRLNSLDIEQVSGFMLHVLTQEKAMLKRFSARFIEHVITLSNNELVMMHRIMENHALLMAFTDCLPLVIDIPEQDINKMQDTIIGMAETRQLALKMDSVQVVQFWDNFDYLNTRFTSHRGTESGVGEHEINHHKTPEDYIAVSIREYFQLARRCELPFIDHTELHKILTTSVENEYISHGTVITSRITKKQIRCFMFKTPEKKARDLRNKAERKGG